MGWVVFFVGMAVSGFFLYDSAMNDVGLNGLYDSDAHSYLYGWRGWLILFILLPFLSHLYYIYIRLMCHLCDEVSLATLPGVGAIADVSWERSRKPKPLISGGLAFGVGGVNVPLRDLVAAGAVDVHVGAFKTDPGCLACFGGAHGVLSARVRCPRAGGRCLFLNGFVELVADFSKQVLGDADGLKRLGAVGVAHVGD